MHAVLSNVIMRVDQVSCAENLASDLRSYDTREVTAALAKSAPRLTKGVRNFCAVHNVT